MLSEDLDVWLLSFLLSEFFVNPLPLPRNLGGLRLPLPRCVPRNEPLPRNVGTLFGRLICFDSFAGAGALGLDSWYSSGLICSRWFIKSRKGIFGEVGNCFLIPRAS